jgi:hypothetical protein
VIPLKFSHALFDASGFTAALFLCVFELPLSAALAVRWLPLMLLSPPKPDFASKKSGAQKYLAPSGALLSKRSEVASRCWRATERPLYKKVEKK